MLSWNTGREVSPQLGGKLVMLTDLMVQRIACLTLQNHSKTTPLLAAEGFMIQEILVLGQITMQI